MPKLILGATGLLGKALMRAHPAGSATGLGSADLDIRDEAQVRAAVERIRPDWIVLAAAYTDVDGCEKNQKLAFDVNCRGAVNVARVAKQCGARLLFLSTDYVFDGASSKPYETGDQPNPRSVYGKSKAEAEAQISEVTPDCCIVRTSWLFGTGGRCFPDTILKLAATRSEIEVVSDQRGSPTYAPDLARTLVRLCDAGAKGIVHATNRGDCTWFEFACEIVRGAGLSTTVHASSSEKFVRPAKRPKYSVLSLSSLDRYGIEMPAWQDGLQRYLQARRLG
jgi:dTDP-4-dehydrorhamnose reductase